MPNLRLKVFFLPVLLILLYLQSCTHAEEKPGGNYVSLEDFYTQNELERQQQFVINGTRDTFLLSRYGTRITIKAGALKDGSGQTFQQVKVNFQEIRDIRDFILSNKPTQTKDKILETDGCFELSLRGGENREVLYFDSKKVFIEWPSSGTVDSAMRLFRGAPQTEKPTGYFVWDYLSGDTINTNQQNNSYSFFSSGFSWINIDKFSKDTLGIRSNISINVPQGFSDENIVVFMVFHEIRSVLSNYNGQFNNVPEGKRVSLIAIGVKETKLYLGEQEFTTPSNDKTLDLEMELTTKNQIKSTLSKF